MVISHPREEREIYIYFFLRGRDMKHERRTPFLLLPVGCGEQDTVDFCALSGRKKHNHIRGHSTERDTVEEYDS
jgi:hypothetical protein